ncbi:CBS domain-containing protein [Pseudonocardia thermophila]|uniref:CBS domain-containing protein n=1 Tax=Pseudonocardia thermophila TaxID=1848 RepID=A0A1M6V2P2_PSETH|nr:CBS domain-containing protein [Pseudonocardia thermophila]SHK75720.1 CBS domain-containing protein [Pseudonocardia thermophila]
MVGIVTEADVLRDRVRHDVHSREVHAEIDAHPPQLVGAVMSTDVMTVDPWTDVAELERRMRDTGFRSVPVVEPDTGLVGIVSRRDIMRALDRTDGQIAADVRAALADYAGRGRWDVLHVTGGVVVLGDPYDLPEERHAAAVVAAGVPGVVDVRIVPA